jgi:hypothetical protein
MQRCRNHSCSPNCICWLLSIGGKLCIGSFTGKSVSYGQELTWDYGSGYYLTCLCASGNCCTKVLDDKSLIFKKTWLPLLIQACAIAVEDDDENVPRLLAVLSQYRFGVKILEESGPLWLKIFCALGLDDITCDSERQLRMPLLSEFADRVIICMRDRKCKRWVIPVFAIDVPEIPALKHYCKSLRPKQQEGWMLLEQQNQCLILDPYDSAAKGYCVKLKKNSWFRNAFNFADWHTLNSSICNIGLQNSPKKKPKTHAAKFHEKTAVSVKGPKVLDTVENDVDTVESLLAVGDDHIAAACLLEIQNVTTWFDHTSRCEGEQINIEKDMPTNQLGEQTTAEISKLQVHCYLLRKVSFLFH